MGTYGLRMPASMPQTKESGAHTVQSDTLLLAKIINTLFVNLEILDTPMQDLQKGKQIFHK